MDIRKLAYETARVIIGNVRNYALNWTQIRVGETPKIPYIVVPHHNTGFDGVLVSSLIPERVHFWMQFEGVFNSNWRKVLELFEQVPIKLNGRLDREGLKKARQKSLEYLRQPGNVIGLFNDGPSALLKVNERILELEERPNYTGAADLAIAAQAPVVPVSIYSALDFRENFWAWKQSSGLGERTGGSKFRQLLRERVFGTKQDYHVLFSEPLEPIRNKKALAEEIRRKQIEGYNFLKINSKRAS